MSCLHLTELLILKYNIHIKHIIHNELFSNNSETNRKGNALESVRNVNLDLKTRPVHPIHFNSHFTLHFTTGVIFSDCVNDQAVFRLGSILMENILLIYLFIY